jgi:hypothetical protein
MRACSIFMLFEAALYVCGYSRVDAFIFAFKKIHKVGHRNEALFFFFVLYQVPNKEGDHRDQETDRAERILARIGEKMSERHREGLHMELRVQHNVDPTGKAEHEQRQK